MDEKSAAAASEKADAIRVKVGFPISPDTRQARSIALYYRLVEIKEEKFFENILSAAWVCQHQTKTITYWKLFNGLSR